MSISKITACRGGLQSHSKHLSVHSHPSRLEIESLTCTFFFFSLPCHGTYEATCISPRNVDVRMRRHRTTRRTQKIETTICPSVSIGLILIEATNVQSLYLGATGSATLPLALQTPSVAHQNKPLHVKHHDSKDRLCRLVERELVWQQVARSIIRFPVLGSTPSPRSDQFHYRVSPQRFQQ